MTALRWFAAIGAVSAGSFFLRRWLLVRQVTSEDFPPKSERRADPDPKALAVRTAGLDRIGFDLERLRQKSSDYKPLVEHLSFIQVKRGEQESLMFVRSRDLDSLAALTGMSKEAFVEEFQQMGVLVSMN
ncbi:MAG: hypothetical protein ACR2FO_04000 [Actinomycetota bacterium]